MKWYITDCLSCARHVPAQWSQLLQSIVTHHSFQLLTMNFIDPMKKTVSAGHEYMLHIINYFSCYSIIYLSATANVSNVIQVLNNLFCQYTQLKAFFLNQGQHFENQVAKEYMKECEIKLLFKSSENCSAWLSAVIESWRMSFKNQLSSVQSETSCFSKWHIRLTVRWSVIFNTYHSTFLWGFHHHHL